MFSVAPTAQRQFDGGDSRTGHPGWVAPSAQVLRGCETALAQLRRVWGTGSYAARDIGSLSGTGFVGAVGTLGDKGTVDGETASAVDTGTVGDTGSGRAEEMRRSSWRRWGKPWSWRPLAVEGQGDALVQETSEEETVLMPNKVNNRNYRNYPTK